MHDIRLKYNVRSRPFPYIKSKENQVSLNLQVPASWNELTPDQLLRLIKIQFSYQAGHLQKLMVLKELLQVKWGVLHLFTSVQRLNLYPLLDFLEENKLTKQLLPKVSVKRVALRPKIKVLLVDLHGPEERFRNLTFEEFIYADTYFSLFASHSNELFLDKLIATIYRPQREGYNPKSPAYKGDIREDFNENLVEDRLHLVRLLPQAVKYAILSWYRGCRKELETIYDLVFTEPNEQKATEGDWGDVLLSLSGGKFGHLEQTSGQRVHTVFKEMQRIARENEEIKRRQHQNSPI
jgi:hypothetical protein